MSVKGVSTLYDDEGNVRAQWVKEQADNDKVQAAIRSAISGFMEPLAGRYKPKKSPKADAEDYMVGLPIGDAHVGLYSWSEQTGFNWDCEKAEAAICTAIDEIIDDVPSGLARECWIWQLGDFLHVDNDAGTTTAGTPQDMDTRFQKVARTAVRTVRYITERALEKFEVVNLRNAKGNHDSNAAVILDEAMKAFYDKEPRLVVHDSAKPVFIHRWHENLFAITHGDKPKPERIPSVLATDAGEDWNTKHKFAHHGHFHSKQRRLFQEMCVDVECHAAASAPDKWTIEQGYRSTSEIKAIVYHKTEGEKRRYTSQVKRIDDSNNS